MHTSIYPTCATRTHMHTQAYNVRSCGLDSHSNDTHVCVCANVSLWEHVSINAYLPACTHTCMPTGTHNNECHLIVPILPTHTHIHLDVDARSELVFSIFWNVLYNQCLVGPHHHARRIIRHCAPLFPVPAFSPTPFQTQSPRQRHPHYAMRAGIWQDQRNACLHACSLAEATPIRRPAAASPANLILDSPD